MELLVTIVPIALTVLAGFGVTAKEVLSKFAEVIKLLTILEKQNEALEQHVTDAIKRVEDLQHHEAVFDLRISDIERYLQLSTQDQHNPFVIRYGNDRTDHPTNSKR
jgi:cell division protein FtsB